MKGVLDSPRMAARNRQRCAAAWRRRFFTEAAFHGLIRDVDLTWDGGHALPRACEGLHVVEFHARGTIVRETVQESAVTDFWRTDAECITAIRRAVHALKALYEANMVGIESEST
jgi:hypothetical protein